ncbi:hypothetical protein DXV75_16980 [Alteromonas aestuariivivens]|uniref:Uncharacterized protein n=1 Tax=Alteromonas aestuariivivens TaxID=1938339 RepID=A0A3D8M2F2_9ALTE|nr:DUF6572 domain-containing protein [Alteromonas aestuariivivens]RDV23869.1 hypothetical protein DXV75_16980 [Alteromonas aestuariivivens]
MDDPIQNLDKIDIIGERKDGGVDLVIVVSSALTDSEYHEQLLKTKIQGYTDTIFSDEWISKYGQGTSDIYIKAQVMPGQEMINLIGAIKNHLKEFNVDLWLEVA